MQLLKKITAIIIVLFSYLPNSGFGQASFYASISPKEIGIDETAELKFIIENAQQAQLIAVPMLQNFNIVSGPNQESGMESINGNVRKYLAYTYIIQPKRKGNLSIEAATARVDGKILKSKPLVLKVSNIASGNARNNNNPFAGLSPFDEPTRTTNNFNDYILKKGDNVQAKISNNIFLKVEPDKTTCFVGEPITVTYKLFTRLKSESNVIKSPSLSDFSVIDLTPTSYENYDIEKLNGCMYNVYTLRKAQLYPLQAGVATLEMIEVENNIQFLKADYIGSNNMADYMNGLLQISLPTEAIQIEKVTLQSTPVSITVKALPVEDSGSVFNGAVGAFSILAWVDKINFSTDNASLLHLTIGGEGNLTLVTAPSIQWPTGIEVFESSVKDTLNKFTVPVSGFKSFSFPFVINLSGNYTIPAIKFCYFDLASNSYKTIQTTPIELTVSKGSGKRNTTLVAPANDDETGILGAIFSNRWMIVLPIILLMFAGLLIWIWYDKKKDKAQAISLQHSHQQKKIDGILSTATPTILQTAINPFEKSEAALLHNDPSFFYNTLNKELMIFIAASLQQTNILLTRKNIEAALDKSDGLLGDIIALKQLLYDIEQQLYSPLCSDMQQQDYYERAMQLKDKRKC